MIKIVYIFWLILSIFGAYSTAIFFGVNGWFGMIAFIILTIGSFVYFTNFGYDLSLFVVDIFFTLMTIYGIICLF